MQIECVARGLFPKSDSDQAVGHERGACPARVRRARRRFPTLIFALAIVIGGCAERDGLEEIRVMQSSGRIEESIEPLQELIDSGDRRDEVLFRYGRALSTMGEIGRAVWALDAVIDNPEYTVLAAKNLAHNAILGGNYDLAISTIERLKETRTDGEGDTDVRALIIEARAYLESRRFYQESLDVIDKILDLEPDNEEAQRYRVAALLGNRQSEEAYEAIRELGPQGVGETLDPDADPDETKAFWCSIAASFQRESGDLAKAEEVVSECLEKFPSDHKVLEEAIAIQSMLGKREEALAILQKASDENPDDRSLRMPVVVQLRALGRYDEAEAILREALEREQSKEFPVSATMANRWNDLGNFLVDRGKLEEGIVAYDEVMSVIGDDVTADFLFARAEVLTRLGRYEEALEIAEQTSVDVHRPMIRGRVAFERGDFQQAEEELGEAARFWPDNAPIRYYLGRTAEVLGDFDRAIEEYRQAIRSDRALTAPMVRLGRLHMAENRVMQAKGIMMLGSPVANSIESVDSKKVMIELEARIGLPIDLRNFPEDPDRSEEDVYSVVLQALSRGLRAREGEALAAQRLAELHEEAPPVLSSFLFVEWIDTLLGAGEADQALTLARGEADKHPDDLRIKMALGRALGADVSTRDEARRVLNAVVAEQPRNWQALVWLGEVEGQIGDPERSLEHFESARSVFPDQSDAILGVAASLDALDRRSEAISRLESYLTDEDPFSGEVALALARLIDADRSTEARRIELGLRALRFGAGPSAAELLEEIDPLRYAIEQEPPEES